ncbi:MAG: hypothetical protein AB7U75_17250 [Hyphomicrobiaceae bacterium]
MMTDETGKELELYDDKLLELLRKHKPSDIALMASGQLAPPTSALKAAIHRFVWRVNTGALESKAAASEAETRLMRTLREHSIAFDELLDVGIEIQQMRQDRAARREIRDDDRKAEITRAAKEREAQNAAARRRELNAKTKAMSAEMVFIRMEELLVARKECQQKYVDAKTEEERKKIELRTLKLDRELANLQRDIDVIQGKDGDGQKPTMQASSSSPDYVALLLEWLEDTGETLKEAHRTFIQVHTELRLHQRQAEGLPKTANEWIALAMRLKVEEDHLPWLSNDDLNAYTSVMRQLKESGYCV